MLPFEHLKPFATCDHPCVKSGKTGEWLPLRYSPGNEQVFATCVLSDKEMEVVEDILKSFAVLPDGSVVPVWDYPAIKEHSPEDYARYLDLVKSFLAISPQKIKDSPALSYYGYAALRIQKFLRKLKKAGKVGFVVMSLVIKPGRGSVVKRSPRIRWSDWFPA